MSAVETLRKARALLTPEGAWGQKFMAVDSMGLAVDLDGPAAVCWCSLGALERAARAQYVAKAREWLLEAIGGGVRSLAGWNDRPERTHAEVLAAFDRAIELAEAAGGAQ